MSASAACTATYLKRSGPATRSMTRSISLSWGSTQAPKKSTTLGCRTWRKNLTSLAMPTTCSTLAPAAPFLAFTATGMPWSQPPTTMPNPPVPSTCLGSMWRSSALSNQCSFRPRASSLAKSVLSSSAFSDGVPTNQRWRLSSLKRRPVSVVSGLDEHDPCAAVSGLDDRSSSRRSESPASSRICSSSAACWCPISLSGKSCEPAWLVTLMPRRNAGACLSAPWFLPPSRLPTTNMFTLTLMPLWLRSVVGNSTGPAFARSRPSKTRVCSSGASEAEKGLPMMSLLVSIMKRWSARTTVCPSSDIHTTASFIMAMIDSISIFSVASARWTS
mmetsp:Transcript_26858/g.72870  ORF Transcript_26858/g.72870 Transcript_26858/m.72870 type:complete len:331 (-) Transcript_26858:311-1303(-)